MVKTIKISNLIDEDITNYKKCAMFIGTVKCTFKCCTELGLPISICQNNCLGKFVKEIEISKIVDRYIKNNLTESVVIGGLEPFDQFDELKSLVDCFRSKTNDDIVIYTGYKEEELVNKINELKTYKNIIVKFGRFVPNQTSHYDSVLGVTLISPNQYGKVVS